MVFCGTEFRKLLVLAGICATSGLTLHAQEVRLAGHALEVHGFATQGSLYTCGNNWLTTNSSDGSGAFTDMGLSVSTQLRSNLRLGAQVYDYNLGQLGQWHPQLDWALLDWRPKGWLGFRVGKVKTMLGLYNDIQDQDFALSWALLPQSIYPIDLRDATIAHSGGDIYGEARLPHHLGTIAYTAYGGHRSDSLYSGFSYLARRFDIRYQSIGGPVYGGDLRWRTPVPGLLLGVSRMNMRISVDGVGATPPPTPSPLGRRAAQARALDTGQAPFWQYSKHDWINQYFGQYTRGRLHLDAEYRRNFQDWQNSNGQDAEDIRGWYGGGGLRLTNWFEVGAYYSHYRDIINQSLTTWPYPQTRDFDKVVSARFNVNRFMTFKVEGQFMNGSGAAHYPNGFYPEQNPNGYAVYTNALVTRLGFSF